MAFKAAFIAHAPDADPEEHRPPTDMEELRRRRWW